MFLKALLIQLESLYRDSDDRFCFISFIFACQRDLYIPWLNDMKNCFSCEIVSDVGSLGSTWTIVTAYFELVFAC